jgi:hypothetical protein
MGRKRRRKKNKWKAKAPGPDKKPAVLTKKEKVQHEYVPKPAKVITMCHSPVKEVQLPDGIAGRLYGGRGTKIDEDDLLGNKIDVFISLSSSAFSAGEYWFGEHLGWAMADYHCWPLAILASRADEIVKMLKSGKRVLVACTGGHGRTGTVLAAVLVRAGHREARMDPTGTIHTLYCYHAVESYSQEVALDALCGDEVAIPKAERLLGTPESPIAKSWTTYGSYGYDSIGDYDVRNGYSTRGAYVPIGARDPADHFLEHSGLEDWVTDDVKFQRQMELELENVKGLALSTDNEPDENDPLGKLNLGRSFLTELDVEEWWDEDEDDIMFGMPSKSVGPSWGRVNKYDGSQEWMRVMFDSVTNKWFEVPEDWE